MITNHLFCFLGGIKDALNTLQLNLFFLHSNFRTVKYAYSIRNWLWTAFSYTAMVDYPTPANFLENQPAYPVKEVVHFTHMSTKLTIAGSVKNCHTNYSSVLLSICFENCLPDGTLHHCNKNLHFSSTHHEVSHENICRCARSSMGFPQAHISWKRHSQRRACTTTTQETRLAIR